MSTRRKQRVARKTIASVNETNNDRIDEIDGRDRPIVPLVVGLWPSRGHGSHRGLVHDASNIPGHSSLCGPNHCMIDIYAYWKIYVTYS